MSKEAAHQLLDAARAGATVTPEEIQQALIATGDVARSWVPEFNDEELT